MSGTSRAVTNDKGDGELQDDISTSTILCLFRGLSDSFSIVTPIKCIYGSQKVRDDTLMSCLLNGVIFLGSMLFFRFVLDPWIAIVAAGCEANDLSWRCLLQAPKSNSENPELLEHPLVMHKFLWNFFFVVPCWLLSKILSNFYFQDIADNGYEHMRIKTRNLRKRRPTTGFASVFADGIFSVVMQVALMLEISLISTIPVFGTYVAFVYTSWQFSLYCFEYTWINKGLTLNERVEQLECGWIYFLAFGSPYAFATLWFDFFTAAALTQLVFPVSVLIAVNARPLRCHSNFMWTRLPICREARVVTNKLMSLLPIPK